MAISLGPNDIAQIQSLTGQTPTQDSTGNWILPDGRQIIQPWGNVGFAANDAKTNTATWLTGQNAGKSWSSSRPWKQILGTVVPIVGGSIAANAFGGGSGGGTRPDSGPTSGAYSADPSGNVEPNGLTPFTPGGTASPSTLLPNLAKFGAGLTGVGLAATAKNPAQTQNAPLLAAMSQLIPLLTQRVQAGQGLYQNAINMAHGMLPKAYQ